MSNNLKFYIDGAWVDPVTPKIIGVVNPATEEVFAEISGGGAADVDHAVAAARAAFPAFARTTHKERLELLRECLAVYNKRYEDIAQACAKEMGAPIGFAREAQAFVGQGHFDALIKAFETFEFTEKRGTTLVVKEPIGVLELAAQPDRLQGRSGPRRRQHHDPQTQRNRPPECDHLRRNHA